MEFFFRGNVELLFFGALVWLALIIMGIPLLNHAVKSGIVKKTAFWLISAVFLVTIPVAMYNNAVNNATQQRTAESSLNLKSALDAVRKHRFDERCSFNGYSVSETWIANDTFPCITLDTVRVWKTSETVGGFKHFASYDVFKIGVVATDGSVTELTEYKPSNGYWFNKQFVPIFERKMDEVTTQTLINVMKKNAQGTVTH